MPYISWLEKPDVDIVDGFNISLLKIDECFLKLVNHNKFPVYLYKRYKECYKCPFLLHEENERFHTKYGQEFRVLSKQMPVSLESSNDSVLCEISEYMGEFGVYEIHSNQTECLFKIKHDAVNIYFPLLTVTLFYTILFILTYALIEISKKLYKTHITNGKNENETKTKKQRLRSLDTFRGICIIFMIFVNYGSGGYGSLEHATWNGIQFSDLFFPWFMWIMGFCIPISVKSALKRGITKRSAIMNVLRRSLILFALGLFLNAGPYLNKLRIFGVLQRFGICYLVVTTIFILLAKVEEPNNKKGLLKSLLQDILYIKFQWLVTILIVMVHCVFTFLLDVPGCPKGYLGPGGLHDDGKYINCTGGATGYIDKIILGSEHIYQYPTIKEIYKSLSFDPEGILGCLTSILQVFLGVQAGVTLQIYKEYVPCISRWLLWGLSTGIVGAILCGFTKEEGIIPLNKNLWSLSFVLVTSGLAFLLLSLCYYIIDERKLWTGKPIMFAGMNSTIMYVGHSIISSNFPFHIYTSEEAENMTHFINLMKNIWSVCMWVLVAYFLYVKRFFLSI